MILITILALVVLTFLGKLIYDVQQNKKKSTKRTIESGFDVDKLQKLAGITGEKHPFSAETIEAIKSSIGDMKFPEPDPSIPMNTTKLTTIGGDYGDSDPLAQIPMSRVSKEAKQKMADIAKEDINKQLEQNTEKFASIFPEAVEYTDEYYKSTLPNEIKEKMLKAVPSENDQRVGIELVKPKRKNTNKNKK
jgi:hypothetical protein